MVPLVRNPKNPKPRMPAAVEDRDFVAGRQAQHPREVLRLVAREHDGLVTRVERRGKESVHRGEL